MSDEEEFMEEELTDEEEIESIPTEAEDTEDEEPVPVEPAAEPVPEAPPVAPAEEGSAEPTATATPVTDTSSAVEATEATAPPIIGSTGSEPPTSDLDEEEEEEEEYEEEDEEEAEETSVSHSTSSKGTKAHFQDDLYEDEEGGEDYYSDLIEEEEEDEDEGEEEEEVDDLDEDMEFDMNEDMTEAQKNLANNKTLLSSDAESSPASEDEFARPTSSDVPPEYWQVQRLVKYIKAGNPTATIISTSSLRDFNLRDKYVQQAIKDAGGLEVFLNILETDENRCKIASLLVLREITTNPEISRVIFNMRGIETLVQTLRDPAKELKLLSAEVLANISKIRKARRAMRKGDGISRLVDMLDIDIPSNHIWHNMEGDLVDFDVPRCGALALWSLARSTKNKDAIRKAGAIPLLARLLQTKNVGVVIPVVGVLHECASEPSFRLAIRTEGLLADFVEGLKSNNQHLVQFCASAIYYSVPYYCQHAYCAEDAESRQIVYELGAIDPLIGIMQDEHLRTNKPLLAAATGAVWKCASAIAKARKYLDQGLVELLVNLLEDEPEYILANVAGAIEQIIKSDPANAAVIKRAGAIPLLIGLLTINNPLLLVNATKAVGQLARDTDARKEMDAQDGFRLVWSLLKHPAPMVQASAAWAICPYVESNKESGDIVRNFVGGLEALVNLLRSEDIQVQAACSQAVAVIALNMENLAIMSDHGVVQYLSRLAPSKNDLLRKCIAEAIAECCKWKSNSAEFGRRKAVSPVCQYLQSEDTEVHRAAARALAALSTDPRNCITMHQCGVVDYLMNMIGSVDFVLANAAADVVYNIRMLAMAAERVRLR